MTSRRLASALIAVALVVSIGLWWWLERGDTKVAPARGREDKTSVPGAELAGREGPPKPAITPLGTPTTRTPTWRLEGSVRGANAAGIAGASVEALLVRGATKIDLGRVRTDRDGAFAFDLSPLRALDAIARHGVNLRMVASADGHGPKEHGLMRPTWPADSEADFVYRQDVDLPAGDVIRGRVVRPDGAPVADADVVSCDGRMWHGYARSLPDGRFLLLRPPAAGEGWSVVAVAEHGVGSAPMDARAEDRDLPDLVLEATDAVEGQVVYADGSPVAHTRIEGEFAPKLEPCVLWSRSFAKTRADGTFRILFPASGDCRLIVSDDEHGVPCKTGDRGVRVVVGMHRIRVRVVDAAGRGLSGPGLSAWTWSPGNAGILDELLAGRLDVFAGQNAADMSASGDLLDDDGSVDFWGKPGSAWAFVAESPGAAPSEAWLRVPLEGHETEALLTLTPPSAGGRLAVRVLDPEGAAVALHRLTVTTVLGSEVFSGAVRDGAPIGPFNPGRLLVLAQPIRQPDDPGWISPLDNWVLPATGVVDVRAGQLSEAVLRPGWGGRVRATLRSPSRGALPATGFHVRAVREDESDRRVLVGDVTSGSDGFSMRWSADVGTVSATLLPPGTWRVEVAEYLGGWNHLLGHAMVSVRPRETTDVTIDLAAR